MAQWSYGFEQLPSGRDFGSVTCSAIRGIKSEFKVRMAAGGHHFDETVSAICYHKSGECNIVKLSDGTPTPEDVIGGLAFDYTEKVLHRDRGGGLGYESMISADHGDLQGLLEDDAHSQYLLVAGDTITNITVGGKVTGLSTSFGDYGLGTEVVSRGAHLGEHPSGGAKHTDGIHPGANNEITLAKLDTTLVTIANYWSSPIGGGGHVECDLGRAPFMPYIYGGPMTLCPAFDDSPPNNYESRVELFNSNPVTGVQFIAYCRRLDAT